MAPSNRVVLDPAVLHGKPVIRGTRLPVTVVVGSLAGGMTFEEVQREYDLTADDIRAALKFVADLAEQESFHPLPGIVSARTVQRFNGRIAAFARQTSRDQLLPQSHARHLTSERNDLQSADREGDLAAPGSCACYPFP